MGWLPWLDDVLCFTEGRSPPNYQSNPYTVSGSKFQLLIALIDEGFLEEKLRAFGRSARRLKKKKSPRQNKTKCFFITQNYEREWFSD